MAGAEHRATRDSPNKDVEDIICDATTPIAIVGIGCRLPGGHDEAEAFHKALLGGLDAMVPVPADRWDAEWIDDPKRVMGTIKEWDQFDARFFGISPIEAQRMDPQHRIMLEASIHALQDAGVKLSDIAATKTGCFVGCAAMDFTCVQFTPGLYDDLGAHSMTGTSLVIVSNRVSYLVDLRGPSFTVDSACSSALLGVHLAVSAIRRNECTAALVGGSNILGAPTTIGFARGGFLSPDGHCKAFDASANGFARSEGCGVVYLKPLPAAIRDGNRIYSVIQGTATNEDGLSEGGMTHPSQRAQKEVVISALKDARLDASKIMYVEAHGTGTSVGDPIEATALGTTLGKFRPEGTPLLVGSIKSNVGHLEAASGLAGLIKLALSMENRLIPGNMHLKTPNPAIDWKGLNVKVPTEPTPYPAKADEQIFAGINSFGYGGANVHVVLSGAPIGYQAQFEAARKENLPKSTSHCLSLSARSYKSLAAIAGKYAELLKSGRYTLQEVCLATNATRDAMEMRAAIVASTTEEAVERLTALSQVENDDAVPGVVRGRRTDEHKLKVAFVCTGQGPQWPRMTVELMEQEPVFANVVRAIAAEFAELRPGFDLIHELELPQGQSHVNDTLVTQPSLMAVQIGLYELWRSRGIDATGIVGHSIGEVAAAYISGALTLKQACYVMHHRSRVQARASGKGKMLAVGLGEEEAAKLLPEDGSVSIGAANSPTAVTLSGDSKILETIQKQLEAKRVFARFLRVDVPFHSMAMEPLKDDLLSSLADLKPSHNREGVELWSTVTGKPADGTHAVAEHWYGNVRGSVLFERAIRDMVAAGYNTFIELSPHPALATYINETVRACKAKAQVVSCMRNLAGVSQSAELANAEAKLWAWGLEHNVHATMAERRVRLPLYVWDRERFWQEAPEANLARRGTQIHPHLRQRHYSCRETGNVVFDVKFNINAEHGYLKDHMINNQVLLPATGFTDLALATGHAIYGDKFEFVEDLHFSKALFLPAQVRVDVSSDRGNFFVYSRPPLASGDKDDPSGWVLNCSGRLNALQDKFVPRYTEWTMERLKKECTELSEGDQVYASLEQLGLTTFGPCFKCLKQVWSGPKGMCLARIELPKHVSSDPRQKYYWLHPCMMDAGLVSMNVPYEWDPTMGGMLPHSLKRACVKIHSDVAAAGPELWCHGVITETTPETLTYDVRYMTPEGKVVAEVQGFKLSVLPGSNDKNSMKNLKGYYNWSWSPLKETIEGNVTPKTGKILVVSDAKAEDPVLAGVISTLGADNCEVVTELTSAAVPERFKSLAGYSAVVLVYAKSVPGKEGEEMDEKGILLLHLSHALMATSRHDSPAIFVTVTRGSQQAITMEDTRGVSQSGIWGMVRTLIMEATPATDCKFSLVDTPYDPSDADMAALLKHVAELAKAQKWISESAVRLGGVLLHVLVHEEQKKGRPLPCQASGGEYVVSLPKGSAPILKALRLEHRPRRYFVCPEHSVVIAVKASALNFRDVMFAAGLLPAEAIEGTMYGREFGLEASGVVLEAGKGSAYKVGDEVVTWAKGCLSGKVVADDVYVHPKPAYLTHEESTALPGVYMTAYYTLIEECRLKKGEWLLLHSAAGGVGIAAINIARAVGAKVIATASPAKHDYLRSLGIEHVFNSGSLEWYDEVMRVTEGHGADVVLNSLSGKAITQGMRCLARRGRFIEIGKTDVYRDSKLSMRLLAENCKYMAIDIDKFVKQDPEYMAEVVKKYFKLIDEQFHKNELIKHNLNVYPISDIANAFVALASGKMMGKVVLSMTAQEAVTVEECELDPTLDPRGTYIVTGGTSGFGLWTANWLVSRGAGRVLLLDIRTTARADAVDDQATLNGLVNAGKAVPFLCDMRNLDNVKAAVAKANSDGFVLRGVFHCAVLFDDKPLANVDAASMRKVSGAKALGAWNLHLATQECRTLEVFVMYSSITAVVGNAAQVNYGNANAFLDGVARFRSAFGLPGTSINWGPIAMRGYLTRSGAQGRRLLDLLGTKGMLGITALQAEQSLLRVIGEARDSLDRNQLVASVMDWSKFHLMYSHAAHDSRFAALMAEANAGDSAAGNEAVSVRAACQKATSVEECQKVVAAHLQVCIARITGAAKAEAIDVNVGLPRLGLDSLMTNQLQSLIFADIGVDVPLLRLVRGPSISTLSQELATEIQNLAAANEKPKESTVVPPAASPSPIPVTPSTSPFLDFSPSASPVPGAPVDNTKRSAKIDIHYATPEETKNLFTLAVKEGWSYNLSDAKIIEKVNPHICVAVTVDGKWAGGYCAAFWASRTAGQAGFGWICMFYVTPEQRDTGAGLELGLHMFKFVKPGNIYGGCAVNHILDTYKGYGFLPHHNDMYFWQDADAIAAVAPGQILEADIRVVEATSVPFEKIDKYDQGVFQWDRSALVKEWIAWEGHTALAVLNESNEVIGYAVSRQVPNGQLVCPFYADNKAAAASLMLQLSKKFPGVKIGFAMDPTNKDAVELTNALGFKKAPTDEECSRVYYGGMPQYPHSKVYGALRGAFSF